MPWKGYPSYTRSSIIKRVRNNTNTKRNEEKNGRKKIMLFRLPYLGQVEDEMKKRCFKKTQKFLAEKVCFFTRSHVMK